MRITGGNVTILGRGDKHNTKYDSFRITATAFLQNSNETLEKICEPILCKFSIYIIISLIYGVFSSISGPHLV